MPTVDSTAILHIHYDELAAELVITFVGGNSYKYFDVPRPVYQRFLRASSKGAFFNAWIKDRYDFAHLRDA
jgi:hypothetical protein